jgi:hypothetical protein
LQAIDAEPVTYVGLIEQADATYRVEASRTSSRSAGLGRAYLWYASTMLHEPAADGTAAQPGGDFDMFAFPAINDRYANALDVGAEVPLSASPDPVTATLAGMITGRSATVAQAPITLSFDASDIMPTPLAAAFQQAVLEYVADPQRLDRPLPALDEVRLRASG